jgi:UDP:flavonoid glycosyltransferase YjiC (YdhE family)
MASRSLKVLIAWELGANLGHLYRLIPVANALIQRGHIVIMAIPDIDFAKCYESRTSIIFVNCPKFNAQVNSRIQCKSIGSYAEILEQYSFGSESFLSSALHDWNKLIDQHQPDVLLIEFAPIALLVSKLRKLAAVHLAIGWEAPPCGKLLPVWGEKNVKNALIAEAKMVERINHFCGNFGVPKFNVLSDLYKNSQQILATLPQFDHFGFRFQSNYIGPIYAINEGEDVSWLEVSKKNNNRKNAFIYLQPDRENLFVIQILISLKFNVIAVLPGVRESAISLYDQRNVRILSKPVKLSNLIKNTHLVISNAGHGLTAASALAGISQILIPRNFEQQLFANKVNAAGLASVLPRDQIAAHFHQQVKEFLSDEDMQNNVNTFSIKNKNVSLNSSIDAVIQALESAQ